MLEHLDRREIIHLDGVMVALVSLDQNGKRPKVLLLSLRQPGQRGEAVEHLNRVLVIDLIMDGPRDPQCHQAFQTGAATREEIEV